VNSHPILEAVCDHVLAQEPDVLRRGLERPGVVRAMGAQREARRRSDVRADIEKSVPFQARAQAAQLQLRDSAREQGAIVRAVDERAARDFPVGCADVETQAVRVDRDRGRHVAQCVEDVTAADDSALSAEVKRPASEVRRSATA